MASLYAITNDMESIFKLIESAVDEDGNPRELTEEEQEIMKQWFACSKEEFDNKFDSYCKLIKNYKIHAQNIDAERKSYKDELDRLSKRAKVCSNNADRLQGMLRWSMDVLGIKNKKTELFTANVQNTQMQVTQRAGTTLENVPDCYLKPRELDTTAIKQAIKDGVLTVGTDGLDYGKVFDADGNQIVGLYATQGTALVIR